MNESILLNAFQYYKVISCHVIRYLNNDKVNLHIQDVVILETLHCYGALSQQELANILGLCKSTIQRTVSVLLQKEMLTIGNDRFDKRKNILHLTSNGNLVIATVICKLKKIMPESPDFVPRFSVLKQKIPFTICRF